MTWNEVSLEAKTSVFIAPANIAKNGKRAVLPLRPELVKALKEYRKTATGDLIFGKFSEFARIRKYWKAAGVPYESGSGYDFSFSACHLCNHAWRNGSGSPCGTGSHAAQRFQMDGNTDTANLNIRAAVEALPGIDEALSIVA